MTVYEIEIINYYTDGTSEIISKVICDEPTSGIAVGAPYTSSGDYMSAIGGENTTKKIGRVVVNQTEIERDGGGLELQ
jgi:hypothetical protein